MASNKSQHYVPQFYLKRFSVDVMKRSINVFNLKVSKLICGASIRGQCAKRYFYGKDLAVEEVLSKQESEISTITRHIINENKLPAVNSSDYISLVNFILFQRLRTLAAEQDVNAFLDSMFSAVLSKDPRFKDKINDYRIRYETSVVLSIGTMSSISFVASDLQCLLVQNESRTSFLTSDNPVYYDNRYMKKRNVYGSHTGLASIGLRIFFPLSPSKLVILFDPAIYEIENNSSGTLIVNDHHTVWGINQLQFAGAVNNIYCDNSFTGKDLLYYMNRSLEIRKMKKHVSNEYISNENPNSSLFEFSNQDPKCSLDLEFLIIKNKALELSLPKSMSKVRDPAFLQLIREFDELVDKGEFKSDQFGMFLNWKTDE